MYTNPNMFMNPDMYVNPNMYYMNSNMYMNPNMDAEICVLSLHFARLVRTMGLIINVITDLIYTWFDLKCYKVGGPLSYG